MGVTLVDSNVILDVLTEDADWGDWSAAMLAEAARSGPLAINPIIYAEVSARFERIEDLDEALPVDLLSTPAIAVRGGLSDRTVLREIPAARWNAAVAITGLLHRCARRACRSHVADTRREEVPRLLPDASALLLLDRICDFMIFDS